MTAELLCRHCDVFFGFGAAGTVSPPAAHRHDLEWLRSHCWMCGRDEAAVRAENERRGPVFPEESALP